MLLRRFSFAPTALLPIHVTRLTGPGLGVPRDIPRGRDALLSASRLIAV
jgi:hypothetical protein